MAQSGPRSRPMGFVQRSPEPSASFALRGARGHQGQPDALPLAPATLPRSDRHRKVSCRQPRAVVVGNVAHRREYFGRQGGRF